MKILIAYDGSECADLAISDLPRAGLPPQAEALVATVADVWPQYSPAGFEALAGDAAPVTVEQVQATMRQAEEEARRLATKAADRVRELFPPWQVSSEALSGAAHQALVEKADQWKADLVVAGSHGRSALGRLVFGSVSQKLLRYASCSVRVARCPTGPDGVSPPRQAPPRLVIGHDGSPHAAAAVEAVLRRHWPPRTEARVVTAVDLHLLAMADMWAPVAAEPSEDAAAPARRFSGEAARRLHEAGLLAVPVIREGDPKTMLIEEATTWDADCVFLGARGHGRLERFLLGSVSASVAMRAPCSVEVVRGAAATSSDQR